MPHLIDRKKFINRSAMAGMALMVTDQLKAFSPVKKDKVRIGIIGAGFRSHEHMGNFLQRDDTEVTAIADPQQRSIDEALAVFKSYNRPLPAIPPTLRRVAKVC